MAHTPLNYRPETLPRETRPYYIGTDENDIKQMLATLGMTQLGELYSHIAPEYKFKGPINLPQGLNYTDLITHMEELAHKNTPAANFIGDGLPYWKTADLVADICGIRGLTTAYTPYQPERSQGTLQTLWIYQSLLSQLTGFEAINASLYERSTCLYEALLCAQRLVKNAQRVMVAETLYPGDIEVLKTHAKETGLIIDTAPLKPQSGTLDLAAIKQYLEKHSDVAAIAFPQVNNLGCLEEVDALTDICSQFKVKSIAVVDPMLLAQGGLKTPATFGSEKQGSDMVVAEGQHLALGPNFGGPGLGIFGIRYNEKDKNSIRSTAGRYIGKGVDLKGRPSLALILSTREQHIRREKATSNICSNQSFVASLAGACLLRKGDQGMKEALKLARTHAEDVVSALTSKAGVELAFPHTENFHEFTLKLSKPVAPLIEAAAQFGLHIGSDISNRYPSLKGQHLLLMAVTDVVSPADIARLKTFFFAQFTEDKAAQKLIPLKPERMRTDAPQIPQLSKEKIITHYQALGKQNLSPDDGIYPLGSCTMKYNPYINDWAASLAGFTDMHPQAPESAVQGSLQVLWEIQEMFKAITGLAAVTTQPVAGAQGELVGIKMFQAYHRDRGEAETRNVLLIPRSAHGTNPATATMAGYETKTVDGVQYGIVTLEADAAGQMKLDQVQELIAKYGKRIAGMMVTNPNTAGIFESNFGIIAQMIHQCGGLVYMDGANMNAIAGIVNLDALGVDAVHNNLHKTWTIPHGGGGPGDGIVAVSHRLVDYLPGIQVAKKADGQFTTVKMAKSVGSFHRHYGNFAHKVRAYTYIKALGANGVAKMSATAVLSARYLFQRLNKKFPTLPAETMNTPRMHEFILTLSAETFKRIEASGTPKANAIARIGKLFLDFGFHAPTVAFPEQYGLMIEPTESYSMKELDQFADVVERILELVNDHPEVLQTVPHFTPIDRVDEVAANKTPQLTEKITAELLPILPDRVDVTKLRNTTSGDLCLLILKAHQAVVQ